MNKKKTFIIIAVLLLLSLIFTISYGFISAYIGRGALTRIGITSSSIDSLTFTSGNTLTLTANQTNFARSSGNLTSNTTSVATLVPRNDTGIASYGYYPYLNILENTFEYGTNNVPELIIDVEVNGTTVIDDYDITNKKGLINLSKLIDGEASYLIQATNNNTTTQSWKVTLTFVNLNVSQSYNQNKTINANLVLQQEEMSTSVLNTINLSNYLKTGTPDYTVSPTDATSGIYSSLDDYGTSYVFRGNINYNWAKFGKESVSTNCTNSFGTKDIMSSTGEKITTEAACETTYSYMCSNTNTIFVGSSISTMEVCSKLGLPISSGNIIGTFQSTAITIEKDMYWRVVRINGNGNLRMIYSGNFAPKANQTVMSGVWTYIGTTSFSSGWFNNAYVGYMYGDINGTTYEEVHANTNSSTIKTYVDNWYTNNTNLGNNTNDAIVADDYFCYDRSIYRGTSENYFYYSGTGIGDKSTAYGAAGRLINSTDRSIKQGANPTLTCPQANDMYTKESTILNNKTTVATGAKVGLLSADEAVMAGTTTSSNYTYYLYTVKWYWLGSPYVITGNNEYGTGGGVYGFTLDFSGLSNTGIRDSSVGVRPVISVNSNYLTGGTGSAQSPWTFSIS